MAAVLKVLAVAFVAAAVSTVGVSAETHHVDGGWGPDFNVTAWLLGRLFTVGDKIRFEYSGADERIVEVGGAQELVTCNLSNPIRMLTDPVSHVALEEEGVRYFTSGDAERCRKGLKLPVTVQAAAHDSDPYKPSPPYDPYHPDVPSPPYEPYKPDVPYPPYDPDVPSPPHRTPPSPAAAARLNGLCFVLAAAMLIYCLAI